MPTRKRSVEEILADVSDGILTEEEGAAEIRAQQSVDRSNRSPRHVRAVVSGTLAFIGFIFFAIGAGFGIYSYVQGQDVERTEGEVIRLVRKGKGSSPVVRYTVAEKPFEIESSISTSPPAYRIGEKVVVLYPRDNPASGRIDSFAERWLFAVIFGGVGLLLLMIAIIVWFAMRPRRLAMPS